MKYFRKINGNGLYLSPLNTEDFDLYCKWLNDPDLGPFIDTASKIFSIEREKEVLAKLANENSYLAIVLNENDEMIGDCSVMNIDTISRSAELGMIIGEKKNRNNGYGSEVLKILIQYCFEILNLNSLYGRIFDFNIPSRKLCEKIGFKECGVRHDAYYVNGCYHDEIFVELLRKNYYS